MLHHNKNSFLTYLLPMTPLIPLLLLGAVGSLLAGFFSMGYGLVYLPTLIALFAATYTDTISHTQALFLALAIVHVLAFFAALGASFNYHTARKKMVFNQMKHQLLAMGSGAFLGSSILMIFFESFNMSLFGLFFCLAGIIILHLNQNPVVHALDKALQQMRRTSFTWSHFSDDFEKEAPLLPPPPPKPSLGAALWQQCMSFLTGFLGGIFGGAGASLGVSWAKATPDSSRTRHLRSCYVTYAISLGCIFSMIVYYAFWGAPVQNAYTLGWFHWNYLLILCPLALLFGALGSKLFFAAPPLSVRTITGSFLLLFGFSLITVAIVQYQLKIPTLGDLIAAPITPASVPKLPPVQQRAFVPDASKKVMPHHATSKEEQLSLRERTSPKTDLRSFQSATTVAQPFAFQQDPLIVQGSAHSSQK